MNAESGRSFATLTHARLRASQGDIASALRILRGILEVQPGHHEARALLAAIENRPAVVHTEPLEAAAEPVKPATAEGLSLRFREAFGVRRSGASIRRLSSWLERLNRHRGGRRVR